jgi:transposase-like protein
MGVIEDGKQRIADLEREIAKRNRWIDQRDRRIEKLEHEIERLHRENEKLQQAAKRQAAPFSKGEPKRNPKRRGRKSGKRYGKRAGRPVPRRVDRIVEVAAPLYCPDCQKRTKLERRETHWQTDIPPIEPETTEFRVDVGRCVNCGRTVRSRHAEEISEATGAAGVQFGPRLIALAATLNKECGVSYERIARLYGAMFGLQVHRSSLNRAVMRLAEIVDPLAEKIGRRVRDAPMLSPDETGWKVGGERAWLHVAATREDSYYMIARGRGTREATALIGIEYSGRIVRDGHPSYRVFSKAKSQTCLAHLLRRIDGLLRQSAAHGEVAAKVEASSEAIDLDQPTARCRRDRATRSDGRNRKSGGRCRSPASSDTPGGGGQATRPSPSSGTISAVHVPLSRCHAGNELSRGAGTSAGSGEPQDVCWEQHDSWSKGSSNIDDRSTQREKTLRGHHPPGCRCPPQSRRRAKTPVEAVNNYRLSLCATRNTFHDHNFALRNPQKRRYVC